MEELHIYAQPLFTSILYVAIEVLELLEGAENGRYKVVAKAEPYKNLPVSFISPSQLIYMSSSPFTFLNSTMLVTFLYSQPR